MQKYCRHIVPSHPLHIRFHKCKIKEVVDLSGKLNKQEFKLLSKGTGYIPKSLKNAKKTLLSDSLEWAWPINKDNVDLCLTKCCNKDYNTMLELKKRKDILIKKADKGNAFVAMTLPHYEAMAYKQLSKKAYEHDPSLETIKEIQNRIRNYIKDIQSNNLLFAKRYKRYLNLEGARDKNIYFLPKIHKIPIDSDQGKIYPGRPITDAVKTFGSKLDKLFSILIQPIRDSISCTILGSLECLLKLEKVSRTLGVNMKDDNKPNLCFLTFDVEDLYTNVPIKEALHIIKVELCKRKIVTGSTLFCLIEAMKLLFSNNAIYFGDKLILQKDGFGMGFHSSPAIADIYVYFTMEQKIFQCKDISQPLFYGRLLDDGLTIFNNQTEAIKFLDKMKTLNSALTFTHEISNNKAVFLDFYLYYNDGFLTRSVYTKETSNMAIIHYKSDHPKNMKKSTIKGRFQWYLRTCNEGSALFSVCSSFIQSLHRNQGYPLNYLYDILINTIIEYHDLQWPFVKNPSARITRFLKELDIEHKPKKPKPDHKRWKGVEFNSCSAKFVKNRVHLNPFYKPAWRVGKNLVKNLTSSNHANMGPPPSNGAPNRPLTQPGPSNTQKTQIRQKTLTNFYPNKT